MNETQPELRPSTRGELFTQQLNELSTAPEGQIEGIFDVLGSFAMAALVTDTLYGCDDEGETYKMVDDIRSKLFDESLDLRIRDRLRGLFGAIHAGSVHLFSRLDEVTSAQLEYFRPNPELLYASISDETKAAITSFRREGFIVTRGSGTNDDPAYMVELTPKGEAALTGYRLYREENPAS